LLDQSLANCEKPEDLTGDDGLFKQFKKALFERALGTNLTEHLGYKEGDPAGRGKGSSRNGTSPKRRFWRNYSPLLVDDLCEDRMKHADQVLADELLVAAVHEALAKRRPKSRSRGRQGTPAEVVLRLLNMTRWSAKCVPI
jgi:hypothetical protein